MMTAFVFLGLSACATGGYPSQEGLAMFLERAEGCAHWSREEAYDEARRVEIETALRSLRRATVVRDSQALKISRQDRPADLNG